MNLQRPIRWLEDGAFYLLRCRPSSRVTLTLTFWHTYLQI